MNKGSRKRNRRNLVAEMIDTAGSLDTPSVFASVTAAARPASSSSSSSSRAKRKDYSQEGLANLDNFCNRPSTPVAGSSSSNRQKKAVSEYERAERQQADRELRAMSTRMKMSSSLNFAMRDFVTPGCDTYNMVAQKAREHVLKQTRWSKYEPKRGERPIPEDVRAHHETLFLPILANHEFGTPNLREWFAQHIASEDNAVEVGTEMGSNVHGLVFRADTYWIVPSLYYKLYLVFLVDIDDPKEPEYYVDYFYVRFCRPIDP